MRRSLFAATVIVGALCAIDVRLAAQKPAQLFISLLGPSGTPVADLQSDEVTVTEDGAERKTIKVEPIDWPIKLQVLVDNGKANTTPINPLRDGLAALFEQLPDDVETAVYTTAPQPRPIGKPSTDKAQLTKNIGLIAPDGGAGAFFDALSEAANRTDRDKTPHFPVILMIGSDFGRVNAMDRDLQKLQENIVKHAMTVHTIVMAGNAGIGSSGGAAQTEIGLAISKLSGGRYENINAATRLATLLPEIGKQIAKSDARQRHQYRVTYERPASVKTVTQVGAAVSRPGTPVLTLDGHMP